MNKDTLLILVEEILVVQCKVKKDLLEALELSETEEGLNTNSIEYSRLRKVLEIEKTLESVIICILDIHRDITLEDIREKINKSK